MRHKVMLGFGLIQILMSIGFLEGILPAIFPRSAYNFGLALGVIVSVVAIYRMEKARAEAKSER
jgi:hypothetical protein